MQIERIITQLKPLFTFSRSEILVLFLVLEFLAFSVAASALKIDNLIHDTLQSAATSSQTYERYQQISVAINSNQYVADGAVFLLWSCVGLCFLNIFVLIRYWEHWLVEVAKLVRRGGPAAEASILERVIQLSIRSLALILLILLFIVCVRYVLPLVITLLDTSHLHQPSEYIFSVIALWLIIICISHLLIIALRGVFLRSRLLISFKV